MGGGSVSYPLYTDESASLARKYSDEIKDLMKLRSRASSLKSYLNLSDEIREKQRILRDVLLGKTIWDKKP